MIFSFNEDNLSISAFGKQLLVYGDHIESVKKKAEQLPIVLDNIGTRLDDYNATVSTSISNQENIKSLLPTDSLDSFLQSLNGQEASLEKYQTYITDLTNSKDGLAAVFNTFNSLDVTKQSEFANAIGSANSELGNYLTTAVQGGQQASVSMKGYNLSLMSAKVSTIGLRAASVALNAAITIGLSLAIQVLIEGISKLVNAEQLAIDKAEEIKSTYESATKTISSNQSTLEKLREEYNKLSKGVDENGKNVGLSAEQYDRYNEIIKEIVGISPSLIKGYDAEGNALVNNNSLLEDAISLQKELNEQKKQEYLSTGEDILSGNISQKKSIRDEIGESVSGISQKLMGTATDSNWSRSYNKVFGDNYQTERDAITDILNQYNIDPASLYSGDIDTVKEFVKDGDLIIEQARTRLELTDDETLALQNTVDVLSVQLDSIESTNKEMASFLTTWAATSQNSDWYNNIETGYLDEFQETLMDIASDESMSIYEMEAATKQLGKSFLIIQDEIPTDVISDLKVQLSNGAITSDEFNIKLAEQIALIDGLAEKYPELAELLKLISQGYTDYSPASDIAEANKISFSDFISTDTNSTAIDDYKSKVSDLQSYLQKIAKDELTEDDKIALATKYSIAADSVEGYRQEIIKLLDTSDTDIMDTLATSIENAETESDRVKFENLRDTLANLRDEAIETTKVFNTLFGIDTTSVESITADVDKITNAILDAKEELADNKKLSSSTLSSLEGVFASDPESLSALQSYNSKLISQAELISVLNKKYGEATDAYSEYVGELYAQSESFYENSILTNNKLVRKFAETYNIDLANFSTLQSLKELAAYAFSDSYESITDNNIAELANKYDVDLANFKTKEEKKLAVAKETANMITLADGSVLRAGEVNQLLYSKQQSYNSGLDNSSENETVISELKEKLEQAQKSQDTITDIQNKILGIEYDKLLPTYTNENDLDGDGVKDDTSSKESSSQVFDWIETKLNNLAKHTEKITNKISDYLSLKKKKSLIKQSISSIMSEIKGQQTAYSKYMAKANSVGLSDSWKRKVQSGDYSINEVSDDKLKGKISNYQEWYEKAQDTKDAVDDLNNSLLEQFELLANAPLENATKKIEILENDIDILNGKLNNADTYKQKNKILDQILKKQKEINAENQKAYKESNSSLQSNALSLISKNNRKFKSDGTLNLKGLSGSQKLAGKTYNATVKGKSANEVNYIDTTKLTGEAYKNAVKYNSALKVQIEAYSNAKKSAEDYTASVHDTAKSKLDNVKDKYDSERDVLSTKMSREQSVIDYKSANGHRLSAKDYSSIISTAKEDATKANKAYDDYLKKYNSEVKNMSKSDKLEAQSYLNTLNEGWQNAKIQVLEYAKAQRQITYDNLERTLELLEATSKAFKSLLDLRTAQGSDLSDDEILQQIVNNNAEIANLEENLKNKIIDYNKTDVSKTADREEYAKQIKDLESEILSLKVEGEQLLDEITASRIKSLEEEKKALEDLKNVRDKALAIEKAEYELEKAKANKTNKVYNGSEYVYEANLDAIKAAQENLDNLNFDELINSIDKAIEQLEELNSNYNLYDKDGNAIGGDVATAFQNAANSIANAIQTAINNGGYTAVTQKFARGGVVKAPKDFGEDAAVYVKDGDRILTPNQNIVFEDFVYQMLPNISKTFGEFSDGFSILNIGNSNIPEVKINIGDIKLEKVNDVDALSRAIVNQLPNKLKQDLAKNK